MKKIALLLLCLVVMCMLAGCVAANPYNSFQSSVIGGNVSETSDAAQPTDAQTTQTTDVQTAQPTDNAQVGTTPTPNPDAPGYNG
jgi:hypothetical protein